MFRKIREWISVFIAKNPARAILLCILILNLVLFITSALIISALAPENVGKAGLGAALFYTVSMVLDAGCVQYVVEDIGQAGVALVIVCILTVIIGMITFTGAVIGYVTNYISNFIEQSNAGDRALNVSGHTVILNWNTRASEIVNDLLYSGPKETVVIVVSEGGNTVKREIADRLSDTINRENQKLRRIVADKNLLESIRLRKKYKLKNRLTIIVREGSTYSSKQLNDISLAQAKSVIVLSKDVQNNVCRYDYKEKRENLERGNSNTIKTLVQVSEITAAENSANDQIVIVEVEDDWTLSLVNKIIEHKERLGKCNIVPVPVNKILGQILSQFSIMPELNTVYSKLFSNKGAEFFCNREERVRSNEWIPEYMAENYRSIPLTDLKTKTGMHSFYIAEDESDLFDYEGSTGEHRAVPQMSLLKETTIEQKNVIILGHNSNSREIMNGFNSFLAEWGRNGCEGVLNVEIIDDKASLERNNYYREYPYVNNVIEADVYDKAVICNAINRFVDSNSEDTSILILSDDMALAEDIDSCALTYLIYVQGIIFDRIEADPAFDKERIDVVVEILNPKNFDVVHNYSVNNVVISNRYISKMVTQISRKIALYEFYQDILTYDDADAEEFESKEIYVKKVKRFFKSIPAECNAYDFVRGIYDAAPESNKSIAIGYVQKNGKTILFSGDLRNTSVKLKDSDKVIVFSNH